MQLRGIPAYIDTRQLTITRQGNVGDNPLLTEIEAVDPQGDSFVVRREQEDTGMTCMMPDVDLTVRYHEANKEADKPHSIGSDEAGDLYFALKNAEQAKDIDPMAGMWILADLQSKGGVGGAC